MPPKPKRGRPKLNTHLVPLLATEADLARLERIVARLPAGRMRERAAAIRWALAHLDEALTWERPTVSPPKAGE